jgi:phospholipase C
LNESKIQHLIVLMLENRSFDHLLGYLDYPPEVSFEGLAGREASAGNQTSDGHLFFPGPNASYLIDPGPQHSHDSVMTQLLGSHAHAFPYNLTNSGFAADYETLDPEHPAEVLQCFTPERLPILSTLAKKFAVCDHWFCSVPGATWPNRNFAHSATSDGEVDVRTRSYTNKTIFEQLSEANRDWAIYYGGFPPQSFAFTRLWTAPDRNWLQRFKPIQNLYRAIRHDHLPAYAFIEPDMLGKISDSQHPGMGGEMDFRAAERLIWRIYTTLRENMAVFNKTLLLITYDEHGGFFDHVPPPQGPEWAVNETYTDQKSGYTFKFDLLGPRVPAVLISPWISPGAVDHTTYDHTSIPATVRKLFQVPGALTPRDQHANTFESILNRDKPRKRLPRLKEPFVDDNVRSLAEGLELRDSLAWILRDLIWTQILNMPKAQPESFAMGAGGLEFGAVGASSLEPEISQQILDDLGPQLSAEAQQAISEPDMLPGSDPLEADFASFGGFFGGLGAIASIVKEKVGKLLENNSLVDDATLVADWFLRKYIQDHNVILRSADDRAFAQPPDSTMQAAIAALFARSDPGASAWLADDQDRWLNIYPDGRAEFYDRDPDRIFSRENVNPDMALQLFNQLKTGNISAIQNFFG